MGLYQVRCSSCGKMFVWFSGNTEDQRCHECQSIPVGRMLSVRNITPSIIHIEYDLHETAAEAFCRLQEHYESPVFAGKIFTFGQFREYYTEQKGKFSYYDDWSGFNIPSRVLEPFRKGLFDPLMDKERELINQLISLEQFGALKAPYYVIGTGLNSGDGIVEHEIMHGLFSTDPEYKDRVEGILAGYDLEPLKKFLRKMGYGEHVLFDECHAYIGADSDFLDEHEIPYPKETVQQLKDLVKARLDANNQQVP